VRAAEPHGGALRLLFNYHGQIDAEPARRDAVEIPVKIDLQ